MDHHRSLYHLHHHFAGPERLVSLSSESAVHKVGRSSRSRSRTARNAARRSPSVPSTRAGSCSGQCSRRTGLGTYGQTSSAHKVTIVLTSAGGRKSVVEGK